MTNTTNTERLKPCPMCGCAATFVKHSAGIPGTQGYDQWDAVACKHCRTTVGACDRRLRNREDACAAWNRRAPAQPEPAAPTVVEPEPVGKRMTVEELARTDGRFPFVWWREVPPGSLLYLAAPPRTPLTDAEIRKIAVEQASSSFGPADNDDETIDWIFNREDLLIFARAVIAASEGERK